MPQFLWILYFNLSVKIKDKINLQSLGLVLLIGKNSEKECPHYCTVGGALSLLFTAWHSLLHSAILDRLFLLPANSILCLWRRKKKEFCKGGVWQGEGERQARAQPQTPLLSTSSPGPHLAAGHQHPERQVHAAGLCRLSKDEVLSDCWTPSSHRGLALEVAGSLPLPLWESKPGFKWFYYGDVWGVFLNYKIS